MMVVLKLSEAVSHERAGGMQHVKSRKNSTRAD